MEAGEIIAIARVSAAAGLREALASASEKASSVEIAKGPLPGRGQPRAAHAPQRHHRLSDMLGHEMCGSLCRIRGRRNMSA